jgi:hypothetical protein
MFTRLYLICVYIDTQFVKYVHVARWHVWSQAAHQIKLLAAGSNRSASTCPDLLATHIRTASIIVAILPIHTSFKFLHHEAERCCVCAAFPCTRSSFFVLCMSWNACIELCHLHLETLQPPIRNHIWSSSQEVRSSILVLFQQVNRCMHHQDLKRLHHILSCLVSNTQN